MSTTAVRFGGESDENWENSLHSALMASTVESVNFMRAAEGSRLFFMPHSPGIYIALVLKNADELVKEQSAGA